MKREEGILHEGRREFNARQEDKILSEMGGENSTR
jgi:hypothetical protein